MPPKKLGKQNKQRATSSNESSVARIPKKRQHETDEENDDDEFVVRVSDSSDVSSSGHAQDIWQDNR